MLRVFIKYKKQPMNFLSYFIDALKIPLYVIYFTSLQGSYPPGRHITCYASSYIVYTPVVICTISKVNGRT